MDRITGQSTIGEQTVVLDLLKHDMDVFTSVTGKSTIDIVASLNGKLLGIQVKSCAYQIRDNVWNVAIGRIRANKTANVIYKFDNSSCDILAVHLPVIDKICYFKSSEITTSRGITIKTENCHLYTLDRLLLGYTQNTQAITETDTETV